MTRPYLYNTSISVLLFIVLQAAEQMMNMYKFVIDKDVTMLEINPMVETDDGRGEE